MHRFAQRRQLFGSVAAAYDAVRPGYPQPVLDAMVRFAGAPPCARVLELGAGTGQATRQLAAAGMRILAVEPDTRMSELLVRGLGDAVAEGRVEVAISDAESLEIPSGAFDIVLSATAWHWLSERRRWEIAIGALAPAGTLVAIWNVPLWRSMELWDTFADVYRASGAELSELGFMTDAEPSPDALLREWLLDVPAGWRPSELRAAVYRWCARYDAAGYTALINTYADHIALPSQLRERLRQAFSAIIARAGGTVEFPYGTYLLMAKPPLPA